MRTHLPKLMLLGVGGGIAAYMISRRHRAAAAPEADGMAPDPGDPVQMMDELDQVHLDELELDAMSVVDADAEAEIATIEASIDEDAMELDTPEDTTLDAVEASARDVGDLYGVHTPRAQDRQHPDDDAAMDDGQNWIEALETSAAENGPVVEEPLESIVDDDDIYAPPHASDTDDTPVADRGSGGPAGI